MFSDVRPSTSSITHFVHILLSFDDSLFNLVLENGNPRS